MKKAYLILENGDVYTGTSIGKSGRTVGEVVFTTGMGSYMETLTDPSYFGQIITQTFPLIGNYGAITVDSESRKSYCKGYIVRELCEVGSNFRKEGELNDWLIEQNIIGIQGIDTRRLTKTIREYGVMNGMITDSIAHKDALLEEIRSFTIKDAPKNTTAPAEEVVGDGKLKIVLIDYGAKYNIARELAARGCEVHVMPCTATGEEILALKPDGIMLSNGGGDPADATFEIEQIKKLIKSKIPTFGICLGHQLMAIASGAKTAKLKYGHRGANQPVKDLKSGRVYITSQNHGYAVKGNTLPPDAEVRFINANDKTCEGVDYNDRPCFTVQFHPEAHGGPLDTEFLFQRFINMVKEGKNA